MIALRCSAMFDGERFVTGGVTVVVDGGVIAGVQAGHPDIGPNLEVVEYPDATVLPGLIDTHVHLVADGGRRALDLVEGYTDDEVDAVMSRSLAAQLAAGVTTVRDLGDRRFAAVDRRDRQRSGSGSDAMKPQFSLEELRLIVETSHAGGIPVTAHAHALPAVELAMQAGMDGL